MNFSLYFPNFPLRTLFSGIYCPDRQALDLDHLLWRDVLRHEIFGHIRHAELVSPTIHHWVGRAKIVGGRRRRDAPFERGGAPGVAIQNSFAAEEAPQKIDKEESLRENGQENRNGDEGTDGADNRGNGGPAAAGVEIRVCD